MLGITVEKGTIIEWMKKEGDPVEKGEIIFIVETEKVTTEVESPASGILAKILVPVGVEVPVLTLAAVITEPGEELPAEYAARPTEAPSPEMKVAVQAEQVSAPAAPHPSPAVSGGPIKAMPAARKLARDKGLDLEKITGTGPGGIILIRDVEAALRAGAEPAAKVSTLARRLAEKEGIPLQGIDGTGVRGRIMRADIKWAIQEAATPSLGKVIPMDTMRQVIARRMSESAFTAPHIYFFTDVWMDPLLDFREVILPIFEENYGLRPSINDLLIKTVALNILDLPLLNATLKGEEIHILPEINIGLAVALPVGLIVPAIANADKAGLLEIVRQRADLVQRARSGKLSMDEIERGTFTISSLSQYDITYFTAILNPPQSGILTVGKTRDELTLVEGEMKVKKVSTFGLSVDHRIIDGTVAADFLQNLKWKLELSAFSLLD
jgi:pyruvate dehydrogenase E2 component (dihydrolipoamide acetyltransferase)